MTPYAMKLAKALMKNAPKSDYLRKLAGAACFDVTDVQPLIDETVGEVSRWVDPVSGQLSMEHGGLLFLPSPATWLEMKTEADPATRVGGLLWRVGDALHFEVRDAWRAGDFWFAGCIRVREGGETFSIEPTRPGGSPVVDVSACGMAFAISLMLINAPRGVERRTTPSKTLLAGDLKRLGMGGLRPFHTIHLAGLPDASEGEPETPAPRKAFHFCRSHIRRLPGGDILVRAHWRGDPALGICRGVYNVADAPPIAKRLGA